MDMHTTEVIASYKNVRLNSFKPTYKLKRFVVVSGKKFKPTEKADKN